jgi:GDPmannose 4,6-dehydratase
MKKALITGITGMDGSHLADLLLENDYSVHGIIRRSSTFNTGRIDHIFDRLNLHHGDVSDYSSLENLIVEINPDEVYNLAAQSHVKLSFDIPIYTSLVTGVGAFNVFEAVKNAQNILGKKIKVYQASSSEMFGNSPPPQNENTIFCPRSPYGVSKLAAFWYARNYREAYDMFISNGILFNHSGRRRGETFVIRKITRAATRIACGLQDKVYLGNLESQRDFGAATDYVKAMWLMLQQNQPDDFVIATGETHSIKEVVKIAFELVNLKWENHVIIDPKYYRPTEIDVLLGDSTKARTILGWKPEVTFEQLITDMTLYDLELAKDEKFLKDNKQNGQK